jgi:hypothetical protein
MECLRSFSLGIQQNRIFDGTFSIGDVKMWGPAGNYHWTVEQTPTSRFQIQGFKSIDLYGIELTGSVQSLQSIANSGIVTDFNFDIGITGSPSLISGQIVPPINNYNLSANPLLVTLGRYSNKIYFESPYIGVSEVRIAAFRANGNNGDTLNSIALGLNVQFKFLYKYLGE